MPLFVNVNNVDPFKLVETELNEVIGAVRGEVETEHPILVKAANYYFAKQGKLLRPTIVLLMAKACNEEMVLRRRQKGMKDTCIIGSDGFAMPSMKQQHLAPITEMIHIASLLHDDVIDVADTRRAVPTVNSQFGNKLAVLAGDFMLARASVWLARLECHAATTAISTSIANLVEGEVMQMKATASDSQSFDYYMKKTYLKTGALMAQSCKAVAALGDCDPDVIEVSFEYGRHLGLAFQIIDDLLDYSGDPALMGKPLYSDLNSGLPTAPVLFAMKEHPQEISTIIARKFSGLNDKTEILHFINNNKGDALRQTRELAIDHATKAVKVLDKLAPSPAVDALKQLTNIVIDRKK